MSVGGSCCKKRATPWTQGEGVPQGRQGFFLRQLLPADVQHMTASDALQWRINIKYSLEKLVDLCVVNRTGISLTTVSRNDPLAAELANEVKETANLLTTCEQFMKMIAWCAGLGAANTPAGSSKHAAHAKPWKLPSMPLPMTGIKKPVFLAKTDFSEKRPDIGPFFWPDVGLSERRPDIRPFIWPILKTIGIFGNPTN